MPSKYHLDDRVSVRITRPIASGFLGEVIDGPRAIVRTRELTWDGTKPAEDLIGQTVDAVVIGFDELRDQLELSLRFATHNPWTTAEERYRPGTEVSGSVTGLIEGAAFVELEPGIEAFLPLSELPLAADERIERWLWLDDQVRCLIEQADIPQHRLRLSLKLLIHRREAEYRHQLWHRPVASRLPDVTIAEILPGEVRRRLLNWARELDSAETGPPLRALVIEDDDAYGAGLRSLLESNGCVVDLAGDGVLGLDQVARQSTPYDLILVDWNLPGPKGHEVIRQLQLDGCPSWLTLMLEPAQLGAMPEVWQAIEESGTDIFVKSEVQACKLGLISILRELRNGNSGAHPAHARYRPEIAGGLAHDATSLPQPRGALDLGSGATNLRQLLEELRAHTGATTVMLLRLETGQPIPEVEAVAGAPFPIEDAAPDVIYSPLNDVLVKRLQVREVVDPNTDRYRRLVSLEPFEGFLGVAVPATDASRDGLFLLKRKGAFTEQDAEEARLSSYLVAGLLQSRRLMQALVPWQGQNLAGQLLNSAIHELSNKLGGMSFQLDALEQKANRLRREPDQATDPTFARELMQDLEQVVRTQRQSVAITGQYLGLIANNPAHAINLVELIETVLRIMMPEAQQHNITVTLKAPKRLPAVHARPGQLEQVLLNLLLNAIQQMAAIGRSGAVAVEITYHPEQARPIQIRFRDEGPGIHTRLWERVFDFGFTTRHGGAGLGLTISRQIVAGMGGTLRIEESHTLWGSTFLLEMPSGG